MSFYYEAEPAKWTYKERYNWLPYPPGVCRKLEKLFQKVQKGDTSKLEINWENNNETWKINVQSFQSNKVGGHSYYNRAQEVSREGFNYPKSGDQNKLARLFEKYQDAEEPDYMREDAQGFQKFCTDVGVNARSVDMLILQGMINNEDFLVIDKQSFKTGVARCGCSSKREIKARVEEIKQAVFTRKKVLKGFAAFLFGLHAESSRVRTLDLSQSAELLMCFRMLYVANEQYYPLAQPFFEFLESRAQDDGQTRSQGDEPKNLVTKDDWIMAAEFLQETQSTEVDPDDADSWPNLISEFITELTK